MFWDSLSFCEFLIFVARVLRTAESRENELSEVSGEMKDEVADTVVRFVLTPPDFFFAEFCNAAFNARPVLVHQPEATPIDIRRGKFVTHRCVGPFS